MSPTDSCSSYSATQRLSQLLKAHKKVFDKGVGTLKGIKAKTELEENKTPKFHKARPVPYALRPKVEADLQNLVECCQRLNGGSGPHPSFL